MWKTPFGRSLMWDHLFFCARIFCMVLTSSFGIIHASGLDHSLELGALIGDSPCSQRKACTISRVVFPRSGNWKRAQGPPQVHCSCFSWGPRSNPCIQTLLHIIMIIQLPMLDDNILEELDKHFEVMYAHADEVISLGLRKHLWIPKLMALTHFCQDIHLGGVSSNWSSETPETLHKLLPKSLYHQTNHKDYHIPMLEMLAVHETKRVRHDYNQWRSSQSLNPLLDHPQDYGIKIAQRPHKQGVPITSLTSKAELNLAGLISEISNFNFARAQDATATSSTATSSTATAHQIGGTHSPWFPKKYTKLDLWWSYRLTVPPFNEFYEKETRTIWCKTALDDQKSKWKGSGSCVFVLVHPERHGIHSMCLPHSKSLSDIRVLNNLWQNIGQLKSNLSSVHQVGDILSVKTNNLRMSPWHMVHKYTQCAIRYIRNVHGKKGS